MHSRDDDVTIHGSSLHTVPAVSLSSLPHPEFISLPYISWHPPTFNRPIFPSCSCSLRSRFITPLSGSFLSISLPFISARNTRTLKLPTPVWAAGIRWYRTNVRTYSRKLAHTMAAEPVQIKIDVTSVCLVLAFTHSSNA